MKTRNGGTQRLMNESEEKPLQIIKEVVKVKENFGDFSFNHLPFYKERKVFQYSFSPLHQSSHL